MGLDDDIKKFTKILPRMREVLEQAHATIDGIIADTAAINWADITALGTNLTAVLADTATIDWSDITTISGKVAPIDWADITTIANYVDDINWPDITTIKSQVASMYQLFVTLDGPTIKSWIEALIPQIASAIASTLTFGHIDTIKLALMTVAKDKLVDVLT